MVSIGPNRHHDEKQRKKENFLEIWEPRASGASGGETHNSNVGKLSL